MRSLVDRGLGGVRLVISDAHAGLRAAIRRVLQDAGWQRCRVHAKRNLLAVARHSQRQVISTIFVQPDGADRDQLRAVVDQLDRVARRSPDVSRRRKTICSPTPRSRPCTGPRSGRTTRYQF
jgi:transposase-like protein